MRCCYYRSHAKMIYKIFVEIPEYKICGYLFGGQL